MFIIATKINIESSYHKIHWFFCIFRYNHHVRARISLKFTKERNNNRVAVERVNKNNINI